MRKPKKIVQWRFAFLVILLVLVNSRFIGIETASLSPAEAAQFSAATLPFSEIILNFSFSTSESSSFFTILLHFWIFLFGTDESILRALPALFSTLTLFPFFGIARILFNKRIAYGAIALYAISPIGAALAQELAPTTLFLLFSLISTWSLLTAIRKPARIYRILYFVAFTIALFANPAAWYLLGFQSIFFLGSYFHHDSGELGFRQWLGAMIAIAVTASITLPGTIPLVESSFNNGITIPLLAYLRLLIHLNGSVVLIIPGSIICLHFIFKNRSYLQRFPFMAGRILFILLWFVSISIPPYLFAFRSEDIGRADGASAALFPFLLLLPIGIDMVKKNTHRHALYIALFIISAITVKVNTAHHEIPWKELFADQANSGIITVDNNLINSIEYYGSPKTKERTLTLTDSLIIRATTPQKVKEFCRDYNAVTLLTTNENSVILLRHFLDEQFTIVSNKVYARPKWRATTEPALQVITYSRKATDL